MKALQKTATLVFILFTTHIVSNVLLFITPVVRGIADGSTDSYYLYLYGFPLKFVTVASNDANKRSAIDSFFGGNREISIQWSQLIISYLIIFVVLYAVYFLVKKTKLRKLEH